MQCAVPPRDRGIRAITPCLSGGYCHVLSMSCCSHGMSPERVVWRRDNWGQERSSFMLQAFVEMVAGRERMQQAAALGKPPKATPKPKPK
jgi:hypothetical protein